MTGLTNKQYYNRAVKRCKNTTCYHCDTVTTEYCKRLDQHGVHIGNCKEYYQLSLNEKQVIQTVTGDDVR